MNMAMFHRFSRGVCGALFLCGLAALPVSAAGMPNGERLYGDHCSGCHGEKGLSVMPQAPDLVGGIAGVKLTEKADQELVDLVRSGRDAMPGYFGILDDEEILSTINYIRTFH